MASDCAQAARFGKAAGGGGGRGVEGWWGRGLEADQPQRGGRRMPLQTARHTAIRRVPLGDQAIGCCPRHFDIGSMRSRTNKLAASRSGIGPSNERIVNAEVR